MTTALELRDFSFRYAGSTTPALSNLSLRIEEGQMVVVMGVTGAGKTTLAKCLNRTIPTFHPGIIEGQQFLFGESVNEKTVADLAGTVGLVSQDFEAQLFATNVVNEIAFGMEQLGVSPDEMRQRLTTALHAVGLSGFEGRDPSALSGGEKQRLAIAATLAMEPRILVFDEPTTDLDPLGKLEVFGVLAAMRKQGYTVVLIEHESSAAEMADRLLVLSGGRILLDGAPEDVLRQVETLEANGVRAPDFYRLAHRFSLPTVPGSDLQAAAALQERVTAELSSPHHQEAAGESPVVLALEDVGYSYEPGRQALSGVSLRIREGELVALIGQNGSGKTTLAKHLNGLLQPSRGRVLLRGRDLRNLPLSEVAAEVGYVFQNPDHQIFAASVYDEVAFGPRNLGLKEVEVDERVRSVLSVVGLDDLRDEDPFVLGKGQRQRLAVASLLSLRPRVLVLDEPTTGLDYLEQQRMMELIRRLQDAGADASSSSRMTFVIITHSPWVVAEYTERGILMRRGEAVFDGSLRALMEQEELLASTHFRAPAITRIGRRLGIASLTLDELAKRVR